MQVFQVITAVYCPRGRLEVHFTHMKIAIVHHHFRRGGFTKVVTAGAAAILEFCPEVEEILLVSGEPVEPIHGMRVLHLPEIGYRADMDEATDAVAEAGHIAELFDRHLSDCVLWIHNYQLGKNGAFTRGVIEYARRHPDRPMLLQIHDFPECGRHGNLAELYGAGGGAGGGKGTGGIYPILPNVCYVTINERDRRLLAECGIPGSRVVRLDNPVPQAAGSPQEPKRELVRKLLDGPLPGTAGRPAPDRPLFIYPVRTIRRKNVLEAALLSRLHEDGANLLVTLPGTSAQEREYSALVRSLFEEGTVAGSFGAGAALDGTSIDFETLARSCDLVLSSSVQEGFGYFFVDALRWGLPLLARNLDILAGIEPLFAGYPHHLYERLMVPLLREERDKLALLYRQRLERLSRFLPEEEREALHGKFQAMTGEELIDFSFLDPGRQAALLRRLKKDDTLMRDIRVANSGLLGIMKELSAADPVAPLAEIEASFGSESFARKAWEVINGLISDMNGGGDPVHGCLLKHFATPEYLRLLYEM